MSVRQLILDVVSFVAIFSSLMIVIVKNPIQRVTFQCQVFVCGAIMFILQDFYFLGLTYIIVYVGAIAIQFIFTIMLISSK